MTTQTDSVITVGSLTLNRDTHETFLDGTKVHFGSKQRESIRFELLVLFARNTGKALSFEYLLDNIEGLKKKHNLKDHVNYLRRNGIDGKCDRPCIAPVRGFGYRLVLFTEPDKQQEEHLVGQGANTIQIGSVIIDLDIPYVYVNSKWIYFNDSEYKLLVSFAQHIGEALPLQYFINNVRGRYATKNKTLKWQKYALKQGVGKLRQKGIDGKCDRPCIAPVRGFGYRLEVPDAEKDQKEHPAAPAGGTITVGSLELDLNAPEVYVDGKRVELSSIEYALLVLLAQKSGMALSRKYLITNVPQWGPQSCDDDALLYWGITALRRKIACESNSSDHDHPTIVLVRRFGFRLQTSVSQPQNTGQVIITGSLAVNIDRPDVRVNDKIVGLGSIAYNLLVLFIQHIGENLSFEFIHHALWGRERDTDYNPVKEYVHTLREKGVVDKRGCPRIVTIRGYGYRLEDPDRKRRLTRSNLKGRETD